MAFRPMDANLHSVPAGAAGVWIRDLEALETRHLAGTENAAALFWSPDSRFLAFGGGGQLKKIEVSGGPPQTLCEAGGVGMGSWSRDGRNYFRRLRSRSSAASVGVGGVPTDITAVDRQRGEGFHTSPIFLPDGRHFLYYRGGPLRSLAYTLDRWMPSPRKQKRERLLATRFVVAYTPSQDPVGGRLFFMRESTLMVPALRRRTAGTHRRAYRGREQLGSSGFTDFFQSSPSGALAYRTGAQAAGFPTHLFDRQGKTVGTFGDLSPDQGIALSADGTRQRSAMLSLMCAEISGRSTSPWSSARGSRSVKLTARIRSGPPTGVASFCRWQISRTPFMKRLRAARAMRKSC